MPVRHCSVTRTLALNFSFVGSGRKYFPIGHICQEESQSSISRQTATGSGSQSKGKLGFRLTLAIRAYTAT